ncbi:hypothetical protein GOEFS_054_00510 [Gordonia effusa NBRC 100432]|uniref:Uncharacterized protein n=1 Tax=Gordonia effusa NBRC 100432 TaxID=1077974 RepID=H0R036_9ACTN|nr:carboxypeptidase-like regulatory domain-containing protein [Gordonia effusa]GAB18437.1 hypothetical protein GOEFS_054_00510 [Gordonia effusa NBRC 100432]
MTPGVNGHNGHLGDNVTPTGAYAEITGVVRRADSCVVAAATVTVIDVDGRQAAHTVTSTEGTFTVHALVEGQYVLVVSADGHQPAAATVLAAASALPIEIVLSGSAGLAGQVTNGASMRPISGAAITIVDHRGQVVATTATDATGQWAVGGIVDGAYTLIVTADGFDPAAESVSYAAASGAVVETALQTAAELSGQVTDGSPSAAPVPHSQVSLVDSSGTMTANAVTNASGRFIFTNVEPGDYTVIASGYAPSATTIDIEPGRFVNYEFTLGAAE